MPYLYYVLSRRLRKATQDQAGGVVEPPVEPPVSGILMTAPQVLDIDNQIYVVNANFTSRGQGSCLWFPKGARGITVSANGLYTITFGSPGIFGGDLESITLKDMFLEQGDVDGPGLGGIRLTNVRSLLLDTLDVTMIAPDEIAYDIAGNLSANVQIVDCVATISDSTDSTGFRVNGVGAGGLSMTGLTVTGHASSNGIEVRNSPNAVITGNTVTGCTDAGKYGLKIINCPGATENSNTLNGAAKYIRRSPPLADVG